MVDVESPGTSVGVGSSDLDSARESYLSNADYAETGDVVKGRAFATACRRLLVLMPKRAAHGRGAEEVEFDPTVLRMELDKCEKFVSVAAASANGNRGVRGASFRGFR